MPSDTDGIREVDVMLSETSNSHVELLFGPHHRVRIAEEGEDITFEFVATHHGFKAYASGDPATELEKIISLVRKERPELKVD